VSSPSKYRGRNNRAGQPHVAFEQTSVMETIAAIAMPATAYRRLRNPSEETVQANPHPRTAAGSQDERKADAHRAMMPASPLRGEGIGASVWLLSRPSLKLCIQHTLEDDGPHWRLQKFRGLRPRTTREVPGARSQFMTGLLLADPSFFDSTSGPRNLDRTVPSEDPEDFRDLRRW